MNIIIFGMPMSGKTTIGKILADEKNFNFLDSDKFISQKYSLSLSKLIKSQGIDFFREQELKVIKNNISKEFNVLSLGGGAVNDKTINYIVKYKYKIFLQCGIDTLVGRYIPNEENRPLLYNTTNIEEKLINYQSEREKYFLDCANIIIQADNNSPQYLANQISKTIDEIN